MFEDRIIGRPAAIGLPVRRPEAPAPARSHSGSPVLPAR
jgi:hypothetical protein